MNTRLANFSPLPILRLLLAPRILVVLVGGASWTLGSAYLGIMARFNALNLDPGIESAIFRTLIAMLLLYGLAALLGVIVGEAAQEIFRRPMLNRLPGIAKRVSGASLVLGAVWVAILTATLQMSWQPLGLRLSASSAKLPCPLATLAIASTGYAAGSWLLARVGNGWGWILRFLAFAGLANCTLPLLESGTESTPVALLLLGLAFLATSMRFRPQIVRRMAEGSVATIFGSIKDWQTTDVARRTKTSAPSQRMPPEHFQKNITGWTRAETYARHTALNWISPRKAMVAIAAYAFFMLHIVLLVSWLGGQKQPGEGAVAFLSRRLFSSFGAAGHDQDFVVTIFGMTVGATAFLSILFTDKYFQPISRAVRARLSFRMGLYTGIGLTVSILTLGIAYGALLGLLGGDPWHAGVPIFAYAALLGFLLYPLFHLVSVFARSASARGHYFRFGAYLFAAFATAPMILMEASGPKAAALVSRSPWTAGAVYLLAVSLAFGLLRFFLGRHFRRADLGVG